MKILSLVLVVSFLSSGLLTASDQAEAVTPEVDFAKLANTGEKENRKLIVKIVGGQLEYKAVSSYGEEAKKLYDRLEFEVLSPADYKGKKWHIFVASAPGGSKIEPYRVGQIFELDISSFGLSKVAVVYLLDSKEKDDGMSVERELLKPANQALVPTPMSVTPAAGAPVAPATGAAHL
ncbi:MAG: hypothetical protein QM715_21320 [Nibricoccus sp.]